MKKILIPLIVIIFSLSCAELKPKAPESKAPEIKAAGTKVHECNMCHLPHKREGKILLTKPLSELCISCHPDRVGSSEHKTGIKPSMPVTELPLDADGKMTCITCHDPHAEKGYENLLRAPSFNEICMKCHKGY